MIRKGIIVLLMLGMVGTGALWVMSYLDWPGSWGYQGTMGAYGYILSHSANEPAPFASANSVPERIPYTPANTAPPWPRPTWGPDWSLVFLFRKSGRGVGLTASEGWLLAQGLIRKELPLGTRPPPNRRLRILGFEVARTRWEEGGIPFRGPTPGKKYLPVRHGIEYSVCVPLWAPLTLFAAYPAIALTRGPLRRWRRRRKGLCVKCGYNLTALTEPRCPECGAGIEMP